MLQADVQAGKEKIGLRLGLCQAHSRLQAADQRHRISLVAYIVEDDRGVEIDLRAGSENRTKVKGIRQHANHGERRPVQIDPLPHNPGVTGKLPLPESMTQQHDGLAVVQRFLSREQPSERRLHAERLKEIAGYQEASKRQRLPIPHQLNVVTGGEGVVASYRLEGAVSPLKLLRGIRGIGHTGFPTGGLF